MDEYISREAVLEHLNKCKEDPLFDPDMARICFAISIFIENMQASDVQPVNQWISVKDRLPSENTLVLCYARSTTGEGNSYFLGALAHGEFWFLKVNDIGHVSYPVLHWEVTHWQPLPESPKED